MAKFRDAKTLQKFAAVHASIHNHFNQDRHLNRRDIFKKNRSAALSEWRHLATRDLCFPALWKHVRSRPTTPVQAFFYSRPLVSGRSRARVELIEPITVSEADLSSSFSNGAEIGSM